MSDETAKAAQAADDAVAEAAGIDESALSEAERAEIRDEVTGLAKWWWALIRTRHTAVLWAAWLLAWAPPTWPMPL